MIRKLALLLILFSIVSSSYSPGPDGCLSGDTSCNDYGGSKCCNSTSSESCFTGYHSAVCCEAPSTGCCGRNGYATGGCKCIEQDQKCCGNEQNTVCGSKQCCCGGSTYSSCCNEGESCCFTYAEPLSNHQCCLPGQLCSLQYGCFFNTTETPANYLNDIQDLTSCSLSTGSTTGSTSSSSTTGSSNNLPPSIKIENRGDMFKIVSTAISSNGVDNFDVVFSQFEDEAGMFEIYYSYFSKEGENIHLLDYKVRFLSVIEFVESGNTKGYQPDEDTFVQKYTLPEGWLPFLGPTYDGDIITFSAASTFSTVSLVGYVSDKISPLPKSNRDLKPEEVKFDIAVNFDMLSSRNDTYIALEARIKTWEKVSNDGNGYVTIFGDQEQHASFSWIPTANDADDQSVEVIASDLIPFANPAEPEYTIYFTFDSMESKQFYWDPSLSVVGGGQDVNSATKLFATLWIFALLMLFL